MILLKVTLTCVAVMCLWEKHKVQSYSVLRDAIDLTYDTKDGITVSHPASTKYQMTILLRGEFKPGIYAENNDFTQGEHIGTHMDAPSHFSKGSWRIADIPFQRLAGELVLIDITEKAKTNVDATVDVEDLEKWESEFGLIPEGAVIIMYSGQGKYANNKIKYLGYPSEDYIDKHSGRDELLSNMYFPGFSPEAAQWLVENRKIYGVGSDSVSLDNGIRTGQDMAAHQIFLKANIWGLENMANVDKLKDAGTGMHIYAMVYKITEGSGGPARVFAVPKGHCRTITNGSERENTVFNISLLFTFCLFLLK